VFKFEEQEELHNNIIDKGLLKLCQANLKRAEVMAQQYPDVPIKTQILIGKPFQVIMQWVEEIKPSLLVIGRHGAPPRRETQSWDPRRRIFCGWRRARCWLTGVVGVRPEDIPWIEEDGHAGLPWRRKPRCGFSACLRSRKGSHAAPSRNTCSRRWATPVRRRPSRTNG